MTNKTQKEREGYKMKHTTNFKEWSKEFDKYMDKLPFPPRAQVIPEIQTPYERKMAKFMEKLIDYEFSLVNKSKTLRTRWGTFMWTPKPNDK